MIDEDPGFEQPAGEESPAAEPVPPEPSLSEDVSALLDDTRTYIEAEIQFQKSRAAFALDRGKAGAGFGLAALLLLHLALVALVVGGLMALSPQIGPLGATAVIVLVLAAIAVVLGLAAKRRFARLTAAFSKAGR